MDHTYWQKQTPEQPLFPNMLWSRPENKAQAGKLLVAGGNLHGFAAPAEAYAESAKAGVGLTRVLLPLPVKKLLPKGSMEMEFAPATPSGSFARQALAELLDASSWADGVLLAGDFGRNSETAILLEQYVTKYSGQVTLTKDAAQYFLANPTAILARPNTLLVLSFGQLQKLATVSHFTSAFTTGMDFLRLIDLLHDFSQQHQAAIITKHVDTLFVAINGQVSTTKPATDKLWCIKTAAHASVWWLQNPSKPFESITTSIAAYLHERE